MTRARRGIDELDQDFRKQAEFLRDKNAGYVRILETVESWLVSSDPLARYERGMKDFLGGEPYGRVAWVELETGPDVSGSFAGAAPGAGGPTGALPAALYAHVRARDGQVRTWVLARCQYHPAAVHSDDGAVAEFVGAVTGR